MKKIQHLLILILIFTSSFQSFSQTAKSEVVRKYIHYYNTGNVSEYDSILSENCKSFSKNVILERNELIDIVRNLSKNENVVIKEINSTSHSVRTKEILTDDIITYLQLEPIIRKREYNFDHNNKIKSIFNLEVSFPDDFELMQDKFLDWASYTYPELYDDMSEKYIDGQNISEERRFLLTLLKEEGLEVLDSIGIEDVEIDFDEVIEFEFYDYDKEIKKYKDAAISFDEFRLTVLLKTKDQIEYIFGAPCEIKTISGSHYWYYGINNCNESYSGPRIYYKDNGEDVQQVQILFNDANIAVSVNAI